MQITFAMSINRFLTNALYKVLRPTKHRLDFILQTDSRIPFSSLSKMNCQKIFSQPDLQKTAQNVSNHEYSRRASSKCLLKRNPTL